MWETDPPPSPSWERAATTWEVGGKGPRPLSDHLHSGDTSGRWADPALGANHMPQLQGEVRPRKAGRRASQGPGSSGCQAPGSCQAPAAKVTFVVHLSELEPQKPVSAPRAAPSAAASSPVAVTVKFGTFAQNRNKLSLLRFLSAELTRGYFLEHNEAKYTERRERVYTCMRIPRELEKLMVFGIFLCLDAFLYVFTLLPLRVFLALFRLFTLPCYGLRDRRLLQPAQVCDILKGVILVICYFMMHYVDYSMMYHLIRGQSVIKLYIIYNMLEVADRLFSSFGQDILDALYWTATEPKERKRAHIGVIPHFLMAVLYVFLHAILIMVQATTLNVAFNSHNKSLLTIMMSNNFVEIKGSVFKKFEKNNLFQMSNSDIKERFTNYVLLLIVCLRNMEQFSWNPDHLWVLFPDVCMVIASEIAVDIVKHAFITKFNDITADVYSEYRASLAFDLVSSRQKNAYTDYSDSVARRMGFIPLPLAVLLIRVVTSSIKVQGILSYACVILFYFGLISLKVLNSIVLLGKSCQYVKEAKMEEKLFDPPPSSTPCKPSSKPQSKCKPSQEETLSASVTNQPSHQKENVIPLLVTSNSDQFLTTPDGEEKDITQENSELKHRSSKKDLLDIDRFTICGNRID
ncbi:PREDICTED: transmembrane anterior posterior transformation protein 1 homolog [Myotis brandtii]|uniref:transmembrane anterior posterior transformation protein 1 homolog n=2 Tax=Myotis TaxID=9434 RepID=UPI0007045AB6|nr:PREDICTED: transmembrane anterior posterior transformation protein 1 homolog [Myotis brandtii]